MVETFIAYIMIGMIANGTAQMITEGPFSTREQCDSYLEDLTATVEDGNSHRDPTGRLDVAAFCLATGKGV